MNPQGNRFFVTVDSGTLELNDRQVVQSSRSPTLSMNAAMSSCYPIGFGSLLLPFLLLGQSFAPKLAPTNPVELRSLQGSWVGGTLTQETPGGPFARSAEKITVSIKGNSFHFHRDTNFWFSTTIALPTGTQPQQLHATIRTNAPSQGTNAIGKVVVALVKVEGETLTLATRGDGSDDAPTGFEGDKVTLYEFQKVGSKPVSNPPLEIK